MTKISENRTLKYLYLTTKIFDKKIPNLLFKGNLQKVGIGDILYDEDYNKDRIFALLKVGHYFQDVMAELSECNGYLDDYIFSQDEHMVVMSLKEGSVNKFIKGEYSTIFSEDEINMCYKKTLFKDEIEFPNQSHAVLSKNPEYKKYFLDFINKEFNTNLKLYNLHDNIELDIPPTMANEVFNFDLLTS